MKRKMVLFACGILLTSLVLLGCSKPSAQAEGSENASVISMDRSLGGTESDAGTTDVNTGTTDVNAGTTDADSVKGLNGEWLEKATKLFQSKVPNEDRFVYAYFDGIRGEASYHPNFNNVFVFRYDAMVYQTLSIEIAPDTQYVTMEFNLNYDDGRLRFYGRSYPMRIDGLEAFVDGLIDGTVPCNYYDTSAFRDNAENVKNDLKILYSRLITTSDQAFSEIGVTLEDYGIDFGDKYREVDPTQPTSIEAVINNEHNFEKGVCKDCGMTWTKYMNRTLAAFQGAQVDEDADETDWFSSYGQDSEYGLPGWHYVQYSSRNVYHTDIKYESPNISEGESSALFLGDGSSVEYEIDVWKDEYEDVIEMAFAIKDKFEFVGQGIVRAKYCYSVEISAAPGEFDQIFASKEAFREACRMFFEISEGEGYAREFINAWEEVEQGNVTEEELRQKLEADGCKYYTKDELFDFFWKEHVNLLTAIDKGMVWFDTNLEDAGFNYK